MDKGRKIIIFFLLLAGLCSFGFCDVWKASVVKTLEALVSSCIVVPCSFSHPAGELPTSRLRGIWHLSNDRAQIIYHDDNSRILDNYKGRTKLLGWLGQKNCTLEIMDVKDPDNGPFCFRIEVVKTEQNQPTIEKFSFVEDCVTLIMGPEPPKPELSLVQTVAPGKPHTITCSVRHTCPSHVPTLTWHHHTTKEGELKLIKDMRGGNWETQSILTFTAEDKHDGTEMTCKATFNGGKTSSQTLTLNVKHIPNHNYIIIPVVVGVATAVIFGLFCIFILKKYKKRIAELQNQDGSMWNRMSRLSRRIRSNNPGPSRTERRSIWSRFSRRPARDIGDSGHRSNNFPAKSCGEQKVSKPRLPSPKSQPKSYNCKQDFDDNDDYMNTADLNIYGNV